MGRTARTFRDAVNIEESRWKDFRRTLRPSQRELMDRLFDSARMCADAGTMMTTPRITEVVLLSSLIEALGELDHLRKRLSDLEERAKETGYG
jgi:hypothetical protein